MFKKFQISLLLFLFSASVVFAQTGTLTGTVTDARTGESLPGVNILITELERGASTDVSGQFSISNIPYDTYNVRVTYIGYESQSRELQIDAEVVELNIALEEDLVGMDEVIVTGYTDQSRNKITGSITTVTSKDFEFIPVATFEQRLQGRTPGVFITSGSGQPGTASTVRIRGSASITGGNNPLYVMDGVPISANDFASINSNDIESISVLKDASATAQYGSRGSNGVILITTKRGAVGATQIRYTTQVGASVSGDPKFDMMNTEEKLRFEEILETGAGWASSPNNPDATLDRSTLLETNRDWAETFFRTGTSMTHDLSVSGGNETIRYFVSGSIFGQEGIGIRSELDRYSLRVNTDINATENFEVGFNGTGSYSESSFIESEGGVALANPFAAAYLENPYVKLYNDDGTLNTGPGSTGANAFERLQNDINDRDEFKFVGQTYGQFIYDNFVFRQELSLDFRERSFDRWIDPTTFGGQSVSSGNSGLLSRSYNRLSNFTTNTSIRYRNTFAGRHQVDGYVANEFIQTNFQSFGYTGYGLNEKLGATPASISPGSEDNPELIPGVGGGISDRALWSVLGVFDYSMDNKYNFKATLRRDGSSRFGANDRYAWLWSFGTSWVASSEAFLSDNDIISNLIVRASYGKTGNQFGIGNYQRVATFATGTFAGESTIFPSSPGNDDLQWETAYKLNLGVDFSLYEGRLNGTLDVYNENTEDLFIDQQLSRTAGFTSLEINAGSMRNRGIEIGVDGDVIRTRDFLLNLNANFSYNQNEITDLGQVDEFELGTSIIREGLPLGTHYVVEWAGVDPATGAPLYVDLDGNVTPNFSNDFAKADFGSWLPPTTGGFGLDFSWRNLSVRSQFNYSYGNKIFNNQLFFQENHGFAGFNQRRVMLDIWQEPGDITEVQSNEFPRQFTSKDIEDASYIRFRNLLVSYTLPGQLFNNQVRNIRIFAQGQNLATWTAFTGFDPEEGNNIAQYSYPLPRIFTAGIDINF
ncbi:SusC/RagA family TonB-linked outer membrane protein [Rhodohalobacter sp. 8-1]|uniref:SusC/RagA family TonB-linked outer membrane protein n=1 Tax=Rhodohalobacter sp. 8-1 TaxID=3131972 RepID=UPI0030EEE321